MARRKQQAIFELDGAIDYEPSLDLAALRGKPRRKKARAGALTPTSEGASIDSYGRTQRARRPTIGGISAESTVKP